MKFKVEKLARYQRLQEPVTAAMPIPKAALRDAADVQVYCGEQLLPTQSRITAVWPDGSIKWLLINFLADLPANSAQEFELRFTKSTAQPLVPVLVAEHEHRLQLRTGDLVVTLADPADGGLFHEAVYKGWRLDHRSMAELGVLKDGQRYYTVITKPGWSMIESGPVRAVLEASGTHLNADGAKVLDFLVRIYAFAGKPWLWIDYQVINRSEADLELSGLGWHLNLNPHAAPVRTAVAVSNYRTTIRSSEAGDALEHKIDAEQILYEPNEQIPETLYGTFWADWNGAQGGVAVTIYQAHQNFPKRLAAAKTGLDVELLPTGERLMLPAGAAKTHRIQIHFHEPTTTLEEINFRSLQFQLPDHAQLPALAYHSIGLGMEARVDACIPEIEHYLMDLADFRSRGYGILHWGDGPESGYTRQGRGNGDLVWTNNEYDLPHAAMLMYIHTGERRMRDYLLAAARHWLDVDFCHYSPDPMRHTGHITHSANHVTGPVSVSHQWVEGLLHYYHLTGEAQALDAAVAIGENILRHLEGPVYKKVGATQARAMGWALRALSALYVETYEEKWLKPAAFIVDQFHTWQEQLGAWLAPYTDHTLIRVPFMIAVAINSLTRYYWLRPSAELKQLIITAADDLVQNCRLPDGRFYYKELPSLRRAMDLAVILEALAFAYDLTGDTKFLAAGLTTLKKIISSPVKSTGRKQKKGDAVILEGSSPKNFAMNAPAVLIFYRALTKTGITIGPERLWN